MEFERVVKRLEWLDEEHRKTRSSLSTLEERMTALEASINKVAKQIKPLGDQIADMSSTAARLDQFDVIFTRQREDMNKALDEIEKRHQKREEEIVKLHRKDFEPIIKKLDELKKSIDSEFPPIKRDIKARLIEEARLNEGIKELKPKIDEAVEIAHEAMQTQRVFEESRKQEAKRVNDLQGDLTAIRKRIDEARAKADLNADSWKNMDNRIKQLMASELERKTAQSAFIDQVSLIQLNHDRSYKEWKEKFDTIKQQAQTADTQIQTLEEAIRNAKRAQETYNELNTKLERRINEVTEMQRLTEDRLRQEWVTFKADDQKRWIGYTLSQDEGGKDIRRAIQKLDERIETLDESTEGLHDRLEQTTDATEQQLQELMNVAHEWLSAYERIMGHGKVIKKTVKK
jgi:chromosome segregation ATPase